MGAEKLLNILPSSGGRRTMHLLVLCPLDRHLTDFGGFGKQTNTAALIDT